MTTNVITMTVQDRAEALAPCHSVMELVTPARARSLRDNAHFERQRKISEANVIRLAREQEAGRFIPGTQVFICTLPDGSERIVNGNHTLEAVAKCGMPQWLTLTYMPAADIDHVGRIYAVFDIHKVRSWRDSLRATGMDHSIEMAPSVLAAIGVIESGFAQTVEWFAANRLARIDKMAEYKEAAELYALAIHKCPTEVRLFARRAPIMGIALTTIQYQPSLACEFWSRFAHDEGLVAGDPERALLRWLRNNKFTAGHRARRVTTRATALAWNAAFRGDKIQAVKPNAMSAFYLLGTPYADGLRDE